MRHLIAYLRNPRRLVGWIVLLAALAVAQWLYWTNPDIPPARLVLTYWQIYVSTAAAGLLAYFLIVRAK